MEGIFLKEHSTPRGVEGSYKTPYSLHFLKISSLGEPPTTQEFPVSTTGEYGYFLELQNLENYSRN